MSLYEAQQAFACCTQENEAQALKNLVSTYMAKRKAMQDPMLRISLVKQKQRVYVEPNNAQRINWNE